VALPSMKRPDGEHRRNNDSLMPEAGQYRQVKDAKLGPIVANLSGTVLLPQRSQERIPDLQAGSMRNRLPSSASGLEGA